MKEKEKMQTVFIAVMTVGIMVSMALAIMSSGTSIREFLFVDNDDYFMDFFNLIIHVKDHTPYTEVGHIYPPFSYLFFWILSLMIPEEYKENVYYLRYSQEGQFIFVIYVSITILMMTWLLRKFYIENKYMKKNIIIGLLLFSAPFLYLYERGNVISWTLFFLGFFLLYKDDERKYMRELALISLACAFCMKLYPAIFGVVLLKEKRYIDALRCAIYAVVLFFLPFFVMGGIKVIPDYIQILKLTNDWAGDNIYIGLGYKINFSNTYTLISTLISGEISSQQMEIGGRIAIIISVIALVIVMLENEKWKVYACLSLIMIGFPGFSYQYVLIFMTLPFLMFMSKRDFRKIDWLYLILFLMQFVMISGIPIASFQLIPGAYPVSLTMVLESVSVFLMPFAFLVDFIYDLFAFDDKKKMVKKKN